MICRVCDATDLELAIDLGQQPWCNHFLTPEEAGTEPTYPLRVAYCHKCGTVQLDYTVKKEILFGNHTYLSGITKTLSDHFAAIAREADDRFLKDQLEKNVLDIGSNDGTQLKHFQSMGYDVLGVESSKGTAAIANRNGIPTVNAFFNLEQARSFGRKFDLINAAGVFFHLEELHSVTEGIRESLKCDGVFIVQFLYMKSIVENCAFDQIYHEHLLYYTLRTINVLLRRHDLEMFDAYVSPIHGGSVIAYVGHPGKRRQSERLSALLGEEDQVGANEFTTYLNFSERIRRMRDENMEFLRASRRSGKRIFGFGAPVKGNTLLNYFRVGTDLIECLVEKNELRRGLVSPGMHIPVVIENEIEGPPDIYYVLAWNFKKEILQRNRALLDRGVEFYFPVDPWLDQK